MHIFKNRLQTFAKIKAMRKAPKKERRLSYEKELEKALTLVMAAAMAAGLAGCGNGAKQAEETTAAQTTGLQNRSCKKAEAETRRNRRRRKA